MPPLRPSSEERRVVRPNRCSRTMCFKILAKIGSPAYLAPIAADTPRSCWMSDWLRRASVLRRIRGDGHFRDRGGVRICSRLTSALRWAFCDLSAARRAAV